MAEGDILVEEQRNFNGNGIENEVEEIEPSFEDPPGFVDDVDDEELMGDILRNRPTQDLGLKSAIIVDGIPKVSADRVEKLKSVLHKLFSKCGTILKDYYPVDENNATKG